MRPLIFVNADKEKIHSFLKKEIKKGFFIFEIEPKQKKYSIDDIREIIKESYFYSSKIKVYIFYNFQNSSVEAQNAFLKILEEPPLNVLFVLTVDNQYKIFPTILSRSKVIKFFKKNKNIEKEKELMIESFLKDKKIDLTISEKIKIDDLILFFKKRINQEKKIYILLKKSLKLKDLIEKNNLKENFAIDYLLLEAKKFF